MEFVATHLNTGTRVIGSSALDIAARTGLDIKQMKAANYPEVFGGWQFEWPEAWVKKLEVCRTRTPRSAGLKYTSIQVTSKQTGEVVGVFSSVAEISERLEVPKNMVSAVLRGARASYSGLYFKDLSGDGSVRAFVTARYKYLLVSEDGKETKVQSLGEASKILGCHLETVSLGYREGRAFLGHRIHKIERDSARERLIVSLYSYFRQSKIAPQARRRMLLTKEEFQTLLDSPEFEALYSVFEATGYSFAKKPVLDRIDPRLPYQLGNVEWLSQEDNQRKVKQDSMILRDYLHVVEDSDGIHKFEYAADAERFYKAKYMALPPSARPIIELELKYVS